MAKKAWQGKATPADMTLDELQEAKAAIGEKFRALQEEYGVMQAALSQVDAEIAVRFRLAVPLAGGPSLPVYPAEAISSAEFEDVPVEASEDARTA